MNMYYIVLFLAKYTILPYAYHNVTRTAEALGTSMSSTLFLIWAVSFFESTWMGFPLPSAYS